MEQQTIIDGNKLIALFDGWTEHNIVSLSAKPDFIMLHHDNYPPMRLENIEDMQYHSSWDWLMPVIEKIESIKSNNGRHYFRIHSNSVDISDTDILIYPEGKTKLEVAYLSVVAFIKWYNSTLTPKRDDLIGNMICEPEQSAAEIIYNSEGEKD